MYIFIYIYSHISATIIQLGLETGGRHLPNSENDTLDSGGSGGNTE